MKRKYLLIVVLVILFQAFVPSFFRVEASGATTNQPEVCSWPSEMMSNYFNFQKEAISILLGSKVNERLLKVTFTSTGLFSREVLGLSALDLIANGIVWNIRSSVSNLLTSVVLLLLVSSSVVQSNVEWLAILFKDRPAVREYKEMLDIESEIFDVAYFRSKQINLTRPLEWELADNLNGLIKKYQEMWLLGTGNSLVGGNSSMADVLSDLLKMNAAMKHFIMVGGKLWKSGLVAYHWCLWSMDKNSCDGEYFVLKFSKSAINQLSDDYKDVMEFSACNPSVNYFVSSIDGAVSNGKDSVKNSIQDVKNSMNNLWGALVGKGRWNFKNNRSSMCEWITEYEMAQLRAYWWPNRTCWKWVNASLDLWDLSSVLDKVQEYSKERKAKNGQKEKLISNIEFKSKDFLSELQSWDSTSDKKQQWYKMIWNGSEYNPQFSSELNSNFESLFKEIMDQYWQSLENAISSDISNLLPKGKWLLDQVDVTEKNTGKLKDVLQKIADKQCSG